MSWQSEAKLIYDNPKFKGSWKDAIKEYKRIKEELKIQEKQEKERLKKQKKREKEQAIKEEKAKKAKAKKEKRYEKLKLWYQARPPPKGYRYADMKEAADNGKIFYWGLHKVDKRLYDVYLSKHQPKKKVDMKQLNLQLALLSGKLSKARREYRQMLIDVEYERATKKQLKEKEKEVNQLQDEVNKLAAIHKAERDKKK